MEKQTVDKMEYGSAVDKIIQIMVKYGATHDDAEKLIHLIRVKLSQQKIRAKE